MTISSSQKHFIEVFLPTPLFTIVTLGHTILKRGEERAEAARARGGHALGGDDLNERKKKKQKGGGGHAFFLFLSE